MSNTDDGPSEAERISGETNVDELVSRYPCTARVFIEHRMVCVGCEVSRFETLGEAAEIYRRPLQPLIDDLRRAVSTCCR